MAYPFDCITDLVFVQPDRLEPSDLILIPGGSHAQLMERAAELYHQGVAPYLLPSGGYNAKINQTEGEFLSTVALGKGVPAEAVLREDQARHTFDNARLSWQLIEERGLVVKRVVLVCKAHHSRRALMTYQTVFPRSTCFLVAPVLDGNCITRENWFLEPEKIRIVLTEAEKITRYFGHHIPNWVNGAGV